MTLYVHDCVIALPSVGGGGGGGGGNKSIHTVEKARV